MPPAVATLIEVGKDQKVLPADKLRTHILITPAPRVEGGAQIGVGVRYLCPKEVMRGSLLVQQLLEDVGEEEGAVGGAASSGPSELLDIPLYGVEPQTFAAVYAWLEHDQSLPPTGNRGRLERPLQGDLSTLLDQWSWSYVCHTLFGGKPEASTPVDGFIFKVTHASAVLQIPALQELCSAAIANALRCRSEAKILTFFGVTTPFTSEQEDRVLADYPWLRTGPE